MAKKWLGKFDDAFLKKENIYAIMRKTLIFTARLISQLLTMSNCFQKGYSFKDTKFGIYLIISTPFKKGGAVGEIVKQIQSSFLLNS